MRKKCVGFAFALGLFVILDVTPVQSQPQGKGGKGEKSMRFSFGQPPGGGSGFNGQPPPSGFNGGGSGFNGQSPPSGFNGGGMGMGMGKGGDRGPGSMGYGGMGKGSDRGMGGERSMGGERGPGMGSERGPGLGGERGPSRGPDPEMMWGMMVKVSGGTNTIKFDNIPPDTKIMMKRMTERAGGIPLPETGEWTKEQFMAHVQASTQVMAMNQGGSQGSMSYDGGRDRGGNGDIDPRSMRGKDKDREKKDIEEERPVAIRFGKLPKDSPPMFVEMDGNKDGQIGLHEWRNAGNAILAFQEMDLNGDGLLTVDEYARYASMKIDRERMTAYENGETPAPKAGTRGPGGRPGSSSSAAPSTFGPTEKTNSVTSSKEERKEEKRMIKGSDSNAPGTRGPWGGGERPTGKK
jgi:hypothetical protein